MQILEDLSEKHLELGIEVRWNSLYTMFKSFVENKRAIQACYLEYDFGENQLERLEWELIEDCTHSLDGFYAATMLIQRRDATISIVIPVIRAITRDLEKKQEDGIGNCRFINSLLTAINKRFSMILTNRYVLFLILAYMFF